MIKKYKRVLCVCSAGELRSPTAAWILSNPPYNYNTRSCGTDRWYALVPVTEALIRWADEIVCMKKEHKDNIKSRFDHLPRIKVLDIDDDYEYRSPALIKLIKERYGPTE